jgi:DNA-binding beta-propeller fold protein YncE
MDPCSMSSQRLVNSVPPPGEVSPPVPVWPARLAAIATLALLGCGADLDTGGGGSYPDGGTGTHECTASNECPTGWTCSEFGVCLPPPEIPGDGGAPPPEVEYELGAPVSSLRYVYVAMTEQDALARIDGVTLEVSSVHVGERPEVVATAPGSDTAVVLDAVNGAATIVRPAAESDNEITLRTLPRLNRVDIDPTARYAVAWFDLDKAVRDAGGLDRVGEIGSFQDVTVLRLPPEPVAVDLTVGFRPRAVSFDQSGSRAYVVTEDGVSVIELAAATDGSPTIVAPIAVTTDPFADPDHVEVAVVPTGERAVVHEAERAELRVVTLTGAGAGQMQTLPLPAVPTDVDLTADGSRAYAVLRESSALAVVSLPASNDELPGVEIVDLGGAPVGSLSLSSDGRRGVLYTNATEAEQITVIELDQPDFPHRHFPLQKSVRAVHLAPGGATAVIVHAKAPGAPEDAVDFDELIDRSFGYSVFDLERGFAKLEITTVDPGALAFAPDAPRAYLVLDGGDDEGALAALQTLELDTGVVRTMSLSSPPDTVGVLPGASVAFVSQRHPLGRVTFVAIDGGTVRTITGFDLNSRIID